ncbi:MAG: sugar transferase [Hyphomicrobiaceae bacterium]
MGKNSLSSVSVGASNTRANLNLGMRTPVSQITGAAEREPNVVLTNLRRDFLSGAGHLASHRETRTAHQSERDAVGGGAKRVVDIVIAGTALALSLPLMLLIAMVIKATMGGPVLFSQIRIGRNGVPFLCYKFRSMVSNGDEVLQKHLASDPQAAAEWRETCKLLRDPRVTPLGNILRKSSLDELPQLLNILRGEMSCVGPRPVVPSELERYGANATAYLSSRPGLTGLWQTSGRSKLSYDDRVALDAHYAKNWSLWLDFSIIVKTIPAVLNFHESA